ncbi:MAG: hypothetical protein Q7K35_01775 [bacterium]|nr:hypothetical protein [bacterium]
MTGWTPLKLTVTRLDSGATGARVTDVSVCELVICTGTILMVLALNDSTIARISPAMQPKSQRNDFLIVLLVFCFWFVYTAKLQSGGYL